MVGLGVGDGDGASVGKRVGVGVVGFGVGFGVGAGVGIGVGEDVRHHTAMDEASSNVVGHVWQRLAPHVSLMAPELDSTAA